MTMVTLGLMGGMGRYDDHAIAIGNGALAASAARLGMQMGADAAARATGPSTAQASRLTSGAAVSAGTRLPGGVTSTGYEGESYTVYDQGHWGMR